MTSATASALLAGVPKVLRGELLESYNQIVRNFREHRWEPSELDGGKFCEVSYTILRGHVDGKYPSRASKPKNMVDACKSLEAAGQAFPRSVRIQIPRMIQALYEVRNNRGVGHVGGEVNANRMDALAVLGIAKWILAEMIRVFHQTDVTTAELAVEAITDRTVPAVWEVGDNLRVLDPTHPMKDKMLLVLYSANRPVAERDVATWVEHSNPSVFRRDVIRSAHRAKLIEYDERAATKTLQLSPTGIAYVEERLL